MGKRLDLFKAIFFPKRVSREVEKITQKGDKKIAKAEDKAQKFEATLDETITIKIAAAVGVNKNGR